MMRLLMAAKSKAWLQKKLLYEKTIYALEKLLR